MKIQAFAALQPQGQLQHFSYNKNIKSNDVLIRIKYRSLTGPDIRFINNFWNDSQYPLVPSQEILGKVEKIGSKVTSLKIGDSVGVGYQIWSCSQCEFCNSGYEQFCQKQKVLQVHEYGGLADFIIVDQHFVFPIPQSLFLPETTPLMCSGLTVFSSINFIQMKPKAKIGVIGIGSLGHLAIKILSILGHEVTAITHTKDKIPQLHRLGATHAVLTTNINTKIPNNSFDYLLVTSSITPDWEMLIKLLKPIGTLLVIGLSAEKINFSDYLVADYARKTIVGNYIGSRQDMLELIAFAKMHKLEAEIETHKYNIDNINSLIKRRTKQQVLFSAVLEN